MTRLICEFNFARLRLQTGESRVRGARPGRTAILLGDGNPPTCNGRMQYLGLLFILSQLALGIWGLMLLAGFVWGNRWFALAMGPILATTAIYAVECYHGLGPSLLGLEEFSFALSSALIALSAV